MKFPLPRNLFAPVELSGERMEAVRRAADDEVRQTRDSFQDFLTTRSEQVDPEEWKPIRQDIELSLYKQHGAAAAQRRQLTQLHEPESGGECEPHILGTGKLQGTVADCLLGLAAPTVRQMQLKSACVNDGYVDWAVLASLERPTPAEPFRWLGLKWVVKTHPFLVDAVMRARDLVYVEATGFTTLYDPNGEEERIGYHVKHSVELPEARELTEFKIVRGTFTFCYLYRQRTANVVDVFLRGRVRLKGDAHEALVVATSAEVVRAIPKNLEVARMRKLAYLVRTATPPPGVATWKPATDCTVCSRTVKETSFLATKKICRVCCARVCKSCRVTHTMRDVTRYTPGVTSHKVTFCVRCLHEATKVSGETVAAYALCEDADNWDLTVQMEPWDETLKRSLDGSQSSSSSISQSAPC